MAKRVKLIKKTNYRYRDHGSGYNLEMRLDLNRYEKQYDRGQYEVDSAVMFSMERFMPMRDGNFINKTRIMSKSMAGTGKVCAVASPEGRFLYEGKNMVDEVTGSPYARLGARKVLVSKYSGETAAKENLDLSKGKNPKAQPRWFIPAKRKDGSTWVKIAKRTAGGGTRG